MSGSNRKFGRCKNRPSNARYTAEKRWLRNKEKAIKRHTRNAAKHEIKKLMRSGASSRDYGRITELRQVIAQNHT